MPDWRVQPQAGWTAQYGARADAQPLRRRLLGPYLRSSPGLEVGGKGGVHRSHAQAGS